MRVPTPNALARLKDVAVHDTFQLRDPESERMGVAVGAVLAGPGFQYEEVWVHLLGDTLRCDAVARPSDSLDDQKALALIDRARAVVGEIALASPAFASLLASGATQFGIVDDCGTSWIPIVELVDGQLVWTQRHAAPASGDAARA